MKTVFAVSIAGAIAALSAPLVAHAGDAGKQTAPLTTSSIWEKPAWLTDLSLRVGESYDTNVYLAGAGQEYFPATLPAGDIATRNKGSWVTTVSPKIGVDFTKLLGSDSILKVFSLGYAPDFVIFHDAPSETYASHRITTNIKAVSDPVTLSLENAFTYIDGSHEGLIYPGGSSSFVNGTVRERRDQWQERTKASVKVDLGPVFVRPVASLLYYDLATDFKNISGYTNYVNRYDVNGGADLGYNLTKDVALIAGYRYGHQSQQTLPFDLTQTNVTNDYQRVLFGVEGSPLKWIKVEAVVGPQFTTYTDNRPLAAGGTPDKVYSISKGKLKVTRVLTEQIDRTPTDVYAEASVTIAPTAADSLVFKYKRWNWVSSTGKNAYLDTLYDASFRHQITKALQLELGLRAGNADYNPSALRNDWDYTTSAGLKYAVTKNLSLDLTYAYDRGRNDQLLADVIKQTNVIPATREFERSIISTGVTWKF